MFPPVHSRVVTRYVGSGIKGVGSGIKGVGSGITSKRNHQFFEGPGISLYHFCGIRKICHAFGIKDQTFKYKNGISDKKKKTYVFMTTSWPPSPNILLLNFASLAPPYKNRKLYHHYPSPPPNSEEKFIERTFKKLRVCKGTTRLFHQTL